MPEPKNFLTVAEIASELQVTPKAVRDWIEEGKIAALQLGGFKGRYRVPRASYEAFLKASEICPAQEAAV